MHAARFQPDDPRADACPTVALKAAALMELLVRNDALVDGNKRLAWLATMVLCLFNDMTVTPIKWARPSGSCSPSARASSTQ